MDVGDFTVVVPLSMPLDDSRAMALEWTADWLAQHHQQWPVVYGYWPASMSWSKGGAVESAMRHVRTPGVIVHDADVFVPPDALGRCASSVCAGAPWAMPHDTVYRLSKLGTAQVYARNLVGPHHWVSGPHLERRPHPAPPGGGCVVLPTATYRDVGGIDPRFVGWGGEDISFARALDTLAGPAYTERAPMWHLWHEPQEIRPGRRGSVENERLASLYLDAVGDVAAMRRVTSR